MKALGLALTTLMLAGSAAAQAADPPAEAHGVSVVKVRWQRHVYNPALDEDPLRAANDTRQLERDRRETQRANNILTQLGRDRMPMPTQTVRRADGLPPEGMLPNDPRSLYRYEVKLSNNGAKKIRSLIWEYVLFDAAAQREIGRHAFESKAGIGVGKTKSLSGFSALPPATVVDVSQSDKEKQGQFSERVDIRRIEYEDGTVWERDRQ